MVKNLETNKQATTGHEQHAKESSFQGALGHEGRAPPTCFLLGVLQGCYMIGAINVC